MATTVETTSYTAQIERVERVGNSRNGNARYRVRFLDGSSLMTKADSGAILALGDSGMLAFNGKRARLTLGAYGNIIDITHPEPVPSATVVATIPAYATTGQSRRALEAFINSRGPGEAIPEALELLLSELSMGHDIVIVRGA